MRLVDTPLFGREHELEVLTTFVREVINGNNRVGIIEGVAGIGKTRLLDEVLTYAIDRDLRVLRGTADELERSKPFRPFMEALSGEGGAGAARRGSVNDLFGDREIEVFSRIADDLELGYRISEELANLLEELCTEDPVILALEDLHWADTSTLQAVRFVTRRLTGFPFGLLITLRPIPVAPEVDAAIADLLGRGARHVVLNPLQDDETKQLAEHILSAELGPNLEDQLTGAGGTPLFAIELLAALRDEGAIRRVGGRAEVSELSLPPSLRLTILRRLSFLTEPTLQLLKVASILGQRFSLADLSLMTGRSRVELLSSLTEALRAGVLAEVHEGLAFRHDLIRAAIYEELPTSVRKDLHREAGTALAAASAPAIRVAEQMTLGASPGDPEAVRYLRQAAREAGPASAATKVDLLERAVTLTNPDDPQRRELLHELLLPLVTIGRLEDASAIVRDCLKLETDPSSRIELQRIFATIVFFQGDRAGARDLLASNAEFADASLEERSTDLALAGIAALYAGSFEDAKAFAERGRSLGEECANHLGVSLSLSTLSGVARFQGLALDAVSLGREAVRHAERASGLWADFFIRPEFFLGAACLDADQLDEAETVLRKGLTDWRSIHWSKPWYQMYLAAKYFLTGKWDDAIAEARTGLSFVDDLEFAPFAAVLFPYGLMSAIAVYRGELESAASALTKAEEELATSGPQIGVDTVMWANALLLEAQGHESEALLRLSGAWNLYAAFGYHFAHRWVAADLVRLACRQGELDLARSVVAQLEQFAAKAGAPTAEACLLRCRGLLEDDPPLLVSSVETYRNGPRVLERALACEDAAVALARNDRSDEARPFFADAIQTYEVLGAVRALDRAEARCRPFGLRRGRKGPRRRPSLGWASLTPTERRVIGLVAQGMTNRAIGEQMFISPRTVETHVAHLFAKLEASSRTELAAVAARHLG